MHIECPRCGTQIELAEVSRETRVRCPACGAALKVRPSRRAADACPSCGQAMSPGGVVCVHCGYDLRRGGRVPAAAPQAEDGGARARRAHGALITFVGEWLPGLLRPGVLLGVVVLGAAGVGVIVLGLYLLALGTWIGCALVGAVGLVVYAQAVAWLLDGDFTLLHDALAGLDGARWALFFSLLLLPFTVLFGLLKSRLGM